MDATGRAGFPSCFTSGALALISLVPAGAGEWPGWRGPEANGVSRETGLPETWSRDGENLVWKAPHGGRSTPIVMNGRVYILNRAGSSKTEQERVMCFDAETGHLHWEHRFNIFLTDIPSNRVGWASPCGDPETGYVYAHGVQGTFLCLDRDGKVVWQRSFHEEYGVISGYGGRTNTPVVDGDLVIISFLNSSWGPHARGMHRYLAMDKRTGAVVWWSEPGAPPLDTTYSTPVIAVVKGTRLLIDGNADGGVHAIKVRTGEKVWDFKLSDRGINASVVFWKDRVFACHSEENIDSSAMGRIVCIDATGRGDVTKTHEKWRIDGITAGYSSPAVLDGRLYVFDNAATLYSIDAETGKIVWKQGHVGTVMKASPVLAEGKIYVGEVNSRFCVLKPGADSCPDPFSVTFPTTDGSVIELNGSPAVSNGRIYFTTRDELYAIGFKRWNGSRGAVPAQPAEEPPGPSDAPAFLQVTPADVVLAPGQSAVFTARLFDGKGRLLRASQARWAPKGFKGAVSESGKLAIAQDSGFGAGAVEAAVESLKGEARVRVIPPIPFKVDFEKIDDGKAPPGWVGVGAGPGAKFVVATVEGQKVLKKVSDNMKFNDGETFFGLPTSSGYTLEADVMGIEKRRNLPNMALVNSGYQLILMGNDQELRIVTWIPQPRLDQRIPFTWKSGVWYHVKLRYEVRGEKGLARARIWPRGEAEPEKWTIELEDPIPSPGGAPGLQAYTAGITPRSAGAEAYFDNVQVTRNEP